MQRAAARMAKERLSVFVAPEGTRTESGELLPFKKGVVHLALASGAPIVPMLIDGAFEVHPPGRLFTQPGHIVIRFLPPRTVRGLDHQGIATETEALRALYLTELARLHAERGAGRTRLPTG
jgi:lysophosphatidate acyltransferase